MDTQIQHLFKNPIVYHLYKELISQLENFGKVIQEPKKDSIHLVNSKGFAGIHPRSNYFILNIVSASPIKSARIVKQDQVSKSRFHNEIRIEGKEDIDSELLDWLKEAYQLMV